MARWAGHHGVGVGLAVGAVGGGGAAQSVSENTLMLGYRLASLVLPLTGFWGSMRMTFPFFPVSTQDALFCPTLCEVMPASCHKTPSYRAAAGSI